MAPDAVSEWLQVLPKGARVLDPMCGSGVVLRQSAELGLKAQGFDVDPLAVLMSRVWTRKGKHTRLAKYAEQIVTSARRRRTKHTDLAWISRCDETRKFIEYWFAEPQRSDVARIVAAIRAMRKTLPVWAVDALYISLSRIIVTKHAGASLAWDVSHSRPHRVRDENDFDTLKEFVRSATRLATILDSKAPKKSATVRRGDCRQLDKLSAQSIDAIVTSPPYLNAIDYLRGHKLSLVWMGHTIPSLRAVRSGSVGTERAEAANRHRVPLTKIGDAVPDFDKLPKRQRDIIQKYSNDAERMLIELKRVLKKSGRLILVLGDSFLRGFPVSNSKIFSRIARANGFKMVARRERAIPHNKRYLPISSDSALDKRMRREIVQVYELVA